MDELIAQRRLRAAPEMGAIHVAEQREILGRLHRLEITPETVQALPLARLVGEGALRKDQI
ncbi:hypothetical protein [Phenylobacterium sp.]|uniref:hypothetical protein n=1 Tax=Phenylobacterium sp. TaxID=1871053 RepID=UPI002F41466F